MPDSVGMVPVLIELSDPSEGASKFMEKADRMLNSGISASRWWIDRKINSFQPNPLNECGVLVAWITTEKIPFFLLPDTLQKLGVQNLEVCTSFHVHTFVHPSGRPEYPQVSRDMDDTVARETAGVKRPVVGIIDDGIAFAHRRFRRQISSTEGSEWVPRIEWFWDQGQTSFDSTQQGAVPYGVEWTGARTIDAGIGSLTELFRRCTHAGIIDEDEIYRITRQTQVRHRARHGTHVLDLAAGAEPKDPDSPAIVAVQLPEGIAANPGNPAIQWNILEGLAYIIWRAHCITRQPDTSPPPIVVNLSYGVYDGPHDGSLFLERAMDKIVSVCERFSSVAIVLAAGNHSLARCRARIGPIDPGSTAELAWKIPPDSDRPAFAEFWTSSANSLEFDVIAPDGRLYRGSGQDEAPGSEVCFSHDMGYDGSRFRSLIRVNTTSRSWTNDVTVRSGAWLVRITNKSATATQIEAWIRRSDTPFGMRGNSRQSHFLDGHYEAFDSAGRLLETDGGNPKASVLRSGTLSGFATGKRTVVVGASYRSTRGNQVPTPYTCQGLENGRKPNLIAPGDRSRARPGMLAAGTRTGSVVALNGTSVASPAVVRCLVTALSSGEFESTESALHSITEPLNDHHPDLIRTGGRVISGRLLSSPGLR